MDYDFYPELIVRTPMFSLNRLIQNQTLVFVDDPYFKEALYIASPDLAKLIYSPELILTPELKLSVYRYYNRMCFRCTPFGLFAGCSIAKWEHNTTLISSKKTVMRRTRLDKEFLSKIILKINQVDKIFNQFHISLNNTIYSIGDEYRMIEKDDLAGLFTITALVKDEALDYFYNLIISGELHIEGLIKKGKNFGFSNHESLSYLKMLMKSQLIFPEIDKALPSNELLQNIGNLINGFDSKIKNSQFLMWKRLIKEFLSLLNDVDQNIVGNDILYHKLFELRDQSGIKQSLNRLIQVDHTHKGTAGTISYKVKKSLKKGIDILNLISVAANDNFTFEQFKQRFFKKYEFQEIPLLLALDPESGIDYMEGSSSFDNFLSKEFVGPNLQSKIKPSEMRFNLRFVIHKYEQAIASGKMVIELTDDDLKLMERQDFAMATSTSVFFRVFGNDNVQIENVSGSSGVNLFTRFTDFDSELHRIAGEIAEIEQQLIGDCILAEIIHEPEPRSANVNVFPPLRKYVIPYYTNSSIAPEFQIPLNDLMLSINNGRLMIRSVRLNKEIIPKISSAYNYTKGSPLFRFLGDAQNQGFSGLQFNFSQILPSQKFYPRLAYKNIVFSPATWNIDLKELLNYDPLLSLDKVRLFLKLYNISRFFVISEGDNELLVDIEQDKMLILWIDLLRKRKSLSMKEFLFDIDQNSIVDENGELINNQIIAILINKETYTVKQPNRLLNKPISKFQRNFSLGSEWLYYKIYCGIVSADNLLKSHIPLLVFELKRRELIHSYFFIRYKDPDPHLRLRFHLCDPSLISEVINLVSHYLSSSERSGKIWKLQTDTYTRELERYGIAILESEKIFAIDSVAILAILKLLPVIDADENRLAVGIWLTNDFMNAVGFSADKILQFSSKMKSILKADCQIDADTDKKINSYYRESGSGYLEFSFAAPAKYKKILNKRYGALTKLLFKIKTNFQSAGSPELIEDLMASYIHMSINRLFNDNQKIYEYIIYEYLFKLLSKSKNRKID